MTSLSAVQSSLAKLKPELREKFSVKSIGLFGSIVRSDYSPHSDIDIIVDFDRPIGVEFIDLANYIESELQEKVDLVSRNGIKPQYFQHISPEIIYV